jgi:hypothetical protein
MGVGRSWFLLLALTGCHAATTQADYPDDLYSHNYVLRTQAVLEFADRRDESQLPDAFDLLLDPEGQIRALAWTTIRSLTPGERDFGYRPYLGEDVRFGIVVRWRAWWIASRGDGAQEPGGGSAVAAAERAGG